MGDLRAALRSGEHGLRWCFPETAEVVEEGERLLVLRDEAAEVMWHVTLSSLPFALDDADALRRDLEASARAAFDEAWRPPGPEDPPRIRRTEDPAWSPLIEHATLDVDGGRALRLVRRITYQPGNEIIAGHLVVPTAHGHADVCALARAGLTGVRESIVTMMRDDGVPAPGTQAEYDAPALDARFPEHPLTIVRRALAALPDTIAVTDAMEAPPAEAVLDEAQCALVPPPRYVPVSPAVLHLAPAMRILMRCGIGGWRRALEVWRLDDVELPRRGAREQLRRFAEQVVAHWADEGATDIEQRAVATGDFDGQPQIEQWVRMTAGGHPSRSLLRWWIEPDGVVYRIGSSGPTSVPDAEHAADVDALQRTWRRLDATAATAHRPWWRVW